MNKKCKSIKVVMLTLIAIVLLFVCCVYVMKFSGNFPVGTEIETLLLNDRGTYTPVTVVLPGDGKEKKAMPLVVMAHGYTGTRNSGGARDLAFALAEEGIATVRMDFNSVIDKKTPITDESIRTNQYTLSSMVDDMVLSISYVVDNYKIDVNKIGIYGKSMGGRAAMITANTNAGGYKYKAMALIAPAGNEKAMIHYMGGQEKWDALKLTAKETGFAVKQGIKLTPEWFEQFENYNPADGGKDYKYPVLVIYNVQDYVVTPETSLDCASGYRNVKIIEVDTKDYHGYEMGYLKSELKDKLTKAIKEHFKVLTDN